MWLFTNQGFFSIVKIDNKPDYLLVRSRVKGDIERSFPAADVERSDDHDYLYRAIVPKAQVMDVVMKAVKDIDYTNFKAAVAENDKSRYMYYLQISNIMADLQVDRDSAESLLADLKTL